MKKMRITGAAFICLLLAGSSQAEPDSTQIVTPESTSSDAPRPVRALWIVRDALTSRASVKKAVDEAARGGITDLLVQVRGRGDAYFPSRHAPVAPVLEAAWRKHGEFDPVALMLDLAHAKGLRVHAWLNVYLVWSKGTPPRGHVLDLHPEWASVNASGVSMNTMSFRKMEAAGTEGVYLEPGNCDVVRHFLDVVSEVLERYPVDGIHLDYVRYPRMSVGYSEPMRAGFERKTGFDPIDLETRQSRYARELGTKKVMELDRAWHQWKADQVTALVRNVKVTMDARDSNLVLSAAVRPDPDEALYTFGQDWVTWVNQGWVDAVAPMMYSPKKSTVSRQAEETARRVSPDRVWAGIAIYNQSVSDAVSKLQDTRRKGIEGFAIFSYNSLSGGAKDLRRLTGASTTITAEPRQAGLR